MPHNSITVASFLQLHNIEYAYQKPELELADWTLHFFGANIEFAEGTIFEEQNVGV